MCHNNRETYCDIGKLNSFPEGGIQQCKKQYSKQVNYASHVGANCTRTLQASENNLMNVSIL